MLSSLALLGLYFYLEPQLPSVEGMSDTRLQVPLRIYSSDGSLLGEFGEKRRIPKTLDEIPELVQQAFLAAEDNRFYEHDGVDYQGILRAVINLIKTGERGQGGSTITMQLARNIYLTKEKTYIRKIREIFLALKIEQELSKQKILELYLNKIYLGNRAYGVAAAAYIYYGKNLDELSIAQIAMIAGLPKAPSRYNPVVNPERALSRRNYVLSRMRSLDFISADAYEYEKQMAVTAERKLSRVEVPAPYVNEMVRAEIVQQFGEEAYSRGLNVYTTIKDKLQLAANASLWNGLVDYDHRHGFRGVIRHVELNEKDDESGLLNEDEALLKILEADSDFGLLRPALVLSIHDEPEEASEKKEQPGDDETDNQTEPVTGRYAQILLKNGERAVLPWAGISWARPYVSLNRVGEEPKQISDVLRVGDVIWVSGEEDDSLALAQAPEVQGALVALAPNDGAIQALKGGLDFRQSKFNRVTQAQRQPGSGFKPVIYSAALSKSFTPASLINDAPVVFEDEQLEASWRPENYSGRFHGPTRLRMALYKSRNLVSIRLLRSVGVGYATKYARNFGFDDSTLPHDLSLALGSGGVSPLQMARAYAVLANGGYRVQPYLIDRITDMEGNVLFEADPAVACVACELAERSLDSVSVSAASSAVEGEEDDGSDSAASPTVEGEEEEILMVLPRQAERTLEPRLVYQVNSMLQDVVLRGTGRRALSLGRRDLAGKTGTTNDQKDAWFNGYNPDLVAVTWVGFDQLKPLGHVETGSKAALPIWIDFMKEALAGVPEKQFQRPDGLVTMKINAETGAAASDLDKDAIFEIFRSENAPAIGNSAAETNAGSKSGAPIPEQLF
ncbi:MAG: penicillin-binding protein 1A [Gammaproteobacteria bacterium]|nr:penicillin-binding protein 1A [Gammaproteobacteria bacterium]